MAITLTNRLSAITTDSFDETHLVWVDSGNLWYAVYDDNSGTWRDAQTIATGLSETITSLNLVASETLIQDSSNINSPGLAVVYQQGSENDSDIFYTAAQYTEQGQLQWLASPQALTSDQVGDLEPRAIANNDGAVFVVGQKVNSDNAQNFGVREDTDLYYQSFTVNSSQFPTPALGLTFNTNSSNTPYTLQTLAASFETAQKKKAKVFQGSGFNWNASQYFDTNLLEFNLLNQSPDQPNGYLGNLFKRINIAGSLQAASGGKNPELTLINGVAGPLLNVAASISYQNTKAGQNGKPNKDFQGGFGPGNYFSASLGFSTLYNYSNTPNSQGYFPLANEKGSLGLSFGLKLPLYEEPPFFVDFLGSAGVAFQWQLSPNPNKSYVPPLSPYLAPNSSGSDAFLAVSINIPPLGAVEAIALALLSDITEIIGRADDDLVLDGLDVSIPIRAGLAGGINIPYLFQAILSAQVYLDGKFQFAEQTPATGAFTLGLPVRLTVKALGFLGGTLEYFPEWKWSWDLPNAGEISGALLNDALSAASDASVQGSLITFNLDEPLTASLNVDPNDFEVTVTNADNSTVTIPVFGVVAPAGAEVVSFRLEQTIPYQSSVGFEQSPTIELIYNGSEPLSWFNEGSVPVSNASSPNFVYTYNPTGGTDDDYTGTSNQLVINFNTELNPQIIPDVSQFTIENSDVTVTSVLGVTNQSVALQLSAPIAGAFTVSYQVNDQGLQLQDSNNNPLPSFTFESGAISNTGLVNSLFSNSIATTNVIAGIANDFAQDQTPALALTSSNNNTSNNILIAWSSDAPPLGPISALVNPDNPSQIYINFLVSNLDEVLGGTPQPQQFQVFVNGNPNLVTSIADAELGTVTLTLTSPINAGETVTVSYGLNSDPNESADNLFLTDVTGTTLWIPAFENFAVTNNSDGAGQPLAAVATLTTYQDSIATALTLTFAQNIDSSSLDLSQFSVYANNESITVEPNNYAISQNLLSLILGEPVRQGDLISVLYTPNGNQEGGLQYSNGVPLNGFEVQQVVTAPAVASTVIKTTTNASNAKLESIPGTGNGLDFDPAAIEYNGQNIIVWARVDSSDLNNQAIPGQIYSEEDAAQINQALSASDIYYSIYNPSASAWSVAAPIALNQSGQDQKVALGLGPDNEVIAAWLNTTNDNNETTTSIYWSSFNNAGWTPPKPLLAEITPDAFTELSVEMLGGEAAVFWTESQPSSYSSLVLADNPLVYLRLGELTGTVANNLGTLGTTANGAYTGTVTLNEKGALENPETSTGDPNPAAQFDGGGSLTFDTAIPLTSQGWAVEFWFKVTDLPATALNLLSLELNFLSLEPPNSGSNPVFELSLNGSTLSLNFEGGSLQAPNVAADTWQYVVGSYDAADNTLSLYLNGSLVETSTLTLTEPLPNTAQLTLAGGDSALFLDEVAVYGSPLANATTPFQSLTSDNFTTIPGDQILNQSFGVNPIGSRYTAQYNDPVPAGPEVYYSVLNGSTWQTPEQIDPIAAIVPTILSDANLALWDIVSNTAVANGSRINPNGIADTLFQSTLVSQVGQTLMGISLEVDGQTYSLGTYFNNGSQILAGNQLGVIIDDSLVNSLNPTEAATDFSYPIRSESLDLVLAIDTGTAPNLSNLPTVNSYTLYFADGNSVSYSTLPVFIPPSSEPATADNTQVLGVATVTEMDDSSLTQIDSGFIINTDNSAIATVLAKGFNKGQLGEAQLAYIAVGNRGYTNTSGAVITPPGGGTVQILLAGEDALNNNTTIPLSTTNLSGNPNGILITGLTDNGSANNHVAMSLATGDVDGDSIDDLVIGDANANDGAGAIYVFYGSYLTSQTNQTLDVSQLSTDSNNSMGFVVNGLDNQGGAGFAVAVGQFFTAEGTPAQIAFGAPFAQSEGVSAGNVYLVSVSSSTPTTSLLYPGQTFNITNSDNQAETVGEAAGYSLGVSALKTGAPTPFSGSTLGDDLLIGAPGYRQNITNQWTNLNQLPSGNQGDYPAQSWVATGAVHVLSAQANNGVIRSTQLATYTGPNIPDTNGVAANYFAGTAIAAEDFNGDGRQDLAIAAEGVNGNAGAVYVLNGQDAPVASSSLPLIIPLIPLNTASNLTINGGIPTARVGTVITAAGDINDDNYQDFLITAPQALNGTGQSYLLFGPLNLDEVGALLDLEATSGDSGQVFLLSGDFPYQLAGTAAIGAGDINSDGVDDLLLSAPNAQQLYAVYGHPWLADDGSIKLADLSADNGFVIDGNGFSTFNVMNPEIPIQRTSTTPSLVSYQGTLYMAFKGQLTNQGIWFTTSRDNGNSWSNQVQLPGDNVSTNAPPSLAVDDQGNLYLAYLGLDYSLNIMYSTDGGNTFDNQYQIEGQTSNNSPTLVFYQNTLFTFFTARNSSSDILYVYSENPQSSDSWSTDYAITYNNGSAYQTSANAVSAAVLDNTLYVAYQTGTQGIPGDSINMAIATGTDPSQLQWTFSSVPNLTTEQSPILTSDGETLYLINLTPFNNESNESDLLSLSTSTNGMDWVQQTLPGTSNYPPAATVSDEELYLVRSTSTGDQGMEVLSSSLPPIGLIANNGSFVQILGDVNGDGFADVFSGGTNAGVIVFGKSTNALLDAAVSTDDLIITVMGNLQDVISLGDFNGDGFQDTGIVDTNNNFYLLVGGSTLGTAGQLSLSPVPLPTTDIFNFGAEVGDLNADGFADLILGFQGQESESPNYNTLYLAFGNASGAVDPTELNIVVNTSVNAGGDINGDGIDDLILGNDYLNQGAGGVYALFGNPNLATQVSNNTSLPVTAYPGTTIINAPNADSLNWSAETTINLNANANFSNPTYGDIGNTGLSTVVFNGEVITLWINDNNQLISSTSVDGIDWSPGSLFSDGYQASAVPGLVVFNNTPYTYWYYYNGGNSLFYSPYQGQGQWGQYNQTNLDFNPSGGINLIEYNNSLYLIWQEYDGNPQGGSLYFATSTDGNNWSVPEAILDVSIWQTESIPSLVVFQNTLYAYFVGEGGQGVYYTTYNEANNSWSNVQLITNLTSTNNAITDFGLSLLNVEDKALYAVWSGGNQSGYDIFMASSSDAVNWTVPNQIEVANQNQIEDLYGWGVPNLYLLGDSLNLLSPDATQNSFSTTSIVSISSQQIVFPTNLGSTLAEVGDVNGDGFGDVVIFAPSFDPNSETLGVGYLQFGGATGLDFQSSVLLTGVNLPSARISKAGDVNGDGLDDILMSVPTENSEEGIVYVVFGMNNLADLSSLDLGDLQPITTSGGQIVDGGIGAIQLIAKGGGYLSNGSGTFNIFVTSSTSTEAGIIQATVTSGAITGVEVTSPGSGFTSLNDFQYDYSQGGGTMEAKVSVTSLVSLTGFQIVGLENSLTGQAVSGGDDVNGDGFDDIAIGAPGDDLSYILFGDDFTHTVTQTGTIGADVMLGTATGESFLAGQGDDQIYGQGGVDVVYAGPGNDLVTVTDTYFRRLDGGTGLDTLQFTGYNGQNWDLTTLSPGLRLQDFEILDTRNYGANTLTLNAVTVSQLSSNNTLTLFMDAVDSLVLSADFSQEGTVYQYDQNFLQFTSSSSAATVLLNIPVANVTFTAPSTNTPASILPNESPAAPPTLVNGATSGAPLPSGDGSTYLYVDNPIVSEASGEATFTLRRTGDLSQYLSVAYQTQDGDGKAGNRYLPVAGQLAFNPGESAKTVSVPIPNDGIYTGDRQFGLLVTRLGTSAEAPAAEWGLTVDPQGAQIRNWQASPENGALQFTATASTATPVNLEFTLTGTEPRALPRFWHTESQSFTTLPWSGDNSLSLTYDPAQSQQTYRLNLEEGGAFDADGATNGLLTLSLQMPALIPAPAPLPGERTEGTQGADFLGVAGLTGEFRLWGLRGNDLLLGSEQKDLLLGNSGEDQLFGEGGVDRLYGGSRNDYLDGGPERDFLHGGKGADLFVLRLGEETDRLLDFNPLEGDRIALDQLSFGDLTFSDNQILVGSTALALVFDQQGQPVTDWSAGSQWFVTL